MTLPEIFRAVSISAACQCRLPQERPYRAVGRLQAGSTDTLRKVFRSGRPFRVHPEKR